jgi:hypothetical protein
LATQSATAGSLPLTDAQVQARAFTVLWAIAHIAHLLRAGSSDAPLVWLVLLAALLLIERPTSRLRIALLAIAQLLYLYDELPSPDNHLVIMGFVNLGLLVSVLISIRRRDGSADSLPPAGALPYARLVLLAAYGAAAIAKLNDGFFDSDTSCAVSLFGNAASVFGDPGVQLTDSLAPVLPFFVAGAELAIPILLLVPATRLAGVALTVVFHLLMSLSPTAIALGFAFVVFALVFLYLPEPAARHLRDRAMAVGSLDGRIRWSRSALLVAAAVVVGALLAPDVADLIAVERYPNWTVLAPAAFVVGALLLDAAWRAWRRQWPRSVRLNPRHLAYFVLLGLVVLNAASPYLGGKTITSFTMYSNLQTERATTNHFFLPRVSLATGQDDLVEIIGSSDPILRRVRDGDALITWHALRRRLTAHPTESVQYRRGGTVFAYERALENPELVDLDPLAGRLLAYRLVDREGAAVRCRW